MNLFIFKELKASIWVLIDCAHPKLVEVCLVEFDKLFSLAALEYHFKTSVLVPPYVDNLELGTVTIDLLRPLSELLWYFALLKTESDRL